MQNLQLHPSDSFITSAMSHLSLKRNDDFFFFFPQKGKKEDIVYYRHASNLLIAKYVCEGDANAQFREIKFNDFGQPCVLYIKEGGCRLLNQNQLYMQVVSFLYQKETLKFIDPAIQKKSISGESQLDKLKYDIWEYLTGCYWEIFPDGNVVLKTNENIARMLVEIIEVCDVERAYLPSL
jgi:hypothetical protein